MKLIAFICGAAFLAAASLAATDDRAVLFLEDFATLDNWKPFTFPKIKKNSVYAIEKSGDRHVLRTESNASASAIAYKDSFASHPNA